MDVILFGGTGFIGQVVSQHFIKQGYNVFVASRRGQNVRYGKVVSYDLDKIGELLDSLAEGALVINLAGESINAGRWSKKRKRQILDSRIQTTSAIVDGILNCKQKPALFINASAIGYYGYSQTRAFIEVDEAGDGFLAEVTKQWEEEANRAGRGTRVIFARFGLVLGNTGGALPQMMLPYRLFAGGRVGSGEQWVSWIHIEDIARIFQYCLHHQEIEGALNFTAPAPITMNEFGQALARVLQRPYWLPVPSFALKLLMGEMSEIVLQGQKVFPDKIIQQGYTFQYPTIESALINLVD